MTKSIDSQPTSGPQSPSTVARGNPVEPRVRAAMSRHSAGVTLSAVLGLVLLAELAGHGATLGPSLHSWGGDPEVAPFDWLWSILWATPGTFSWSSLSMFCAVLGGFWGAAELLSVLVIAPFAASTDQSLRQAAWPARRLVFTIGLWWLVRWTAIWLVAFVPGSFVIRAAVSRWPQIDAPWYQILPVSTGFLLLIGLLIRLVRAASYLAVAGSGTYAARCSRCGYPLEGLPDSNRCPECGIERPGQVDLLRGSPPWAQRDRIGWIRAWWSTASMVLRSPRHFFEDLKVLSGREDACRFLARTLWINFALVLAAAAPTIYMLIRFDREQDESPRIKAIALACGGVLLAAILTLAALLVLALAILLLGRAINRSRQERNWPIAVTAGCYCLTPFPPALALQVATLGAALWLLDLAPRRPLFLLFVAASRHLGTAGAVTLLVLSILLPSLLGLTWLVRTMVACHRGVRFAGR